MKLTKKAIEKKYNVYLERGSFNMCDNYMSWRAYSLNEDGEAMNGIGYEVAGGDTLAEIITELDSRLDELVKLKI